MKRLMTERKKEVSWGRKEGRKVTRKLRKEEKEASEGMSDGSNPSKENKEGIKEERKLRRNKGTEKDTVRKRVVTDAIKFLSKPSYYQSTSDIRTFPLLSISIIFHLFQLHLQFFTKISRLTKTVSVHASFADMNRCYCLLKFQHLSRRMLNARNALFCLPLIQKYIINKFKFV